MRQDDEVEFARPIHEPLRRVAIGAWAVKLLPRVSYETGYTPDVPSSGFPRAYDVRLPPPARHCAQRTSHGLRVSGPVPSGDAALLRLRSCFGYGCAGLG